VVAAVLVFIVAAVLPPAIVCAIDMGSNTFRRIVGSFVDEGYQQAKPEASITTLPRLVVATVLMEAFGYSRSS